MARSIGRMTALAVSRIKEAGLYPDGGGLYLQVSPSGARSWTYRFMLNGRAREMGLGPLHTVSLSDARSKAAECRRLRLAGTDPIEARKEKRTGALLDAAKAIKFEDAAKSYLQAHESSWRNATHRQQWHNTLESYVYPIIGALPVQNIDVSLVIKVLEPIWTDKTHTANRLRGRIEAILDWATARGFRRGDNPARWRGHLENLLARPSRLQRVIHHPALPYAEVGAFMALLQEHEGTASLALRFLILTATRTSETIGARWDEMNLDQATWTIPGDRIKTGKEHRVPLSPCVMTILNGIKNTRDGGEFIFQGGRKRRALSNMALLALLHRLGRRDITAHGFRSTFRDWVAERTNYPREVAEMALGHSVGNRVEAAYRRGDLYDKRRLLMDEWARYCANPAVPGKLIPIRAEIQSSNDVGVAAELLPSRRVS